VGRSVPAQMWACRTKHSFSGLRPFNVVRCMLHFVCCMLHAAFRMPRAVRTNAQVLRLEVVVDHADAVHRLDSAEDLRRHSMVWPTQRRLVRVRVNRDKGTGNRDIVRVIGTRVRVIGRRVRVIGITGLVVASSRTYVPIRSTLRSTNPTAALGRQYSSALRRSCPTLMCCARPTAQR
jgi:hypothetical protein